MNSLVRLKVAYLEGVQVLVADLLFDLLVSEVPLLLLEEVVDKLLLVDTLHLLIALHVFILVHLGDASPQS